MQLSRKAPRVEMMESEFWGNLATPAHATSVADERGGGSLHPGKNLSKLQHSGEPHITEGKKYS